MRPRRHVVGGCSAGGGCGDYYQLDVATSKGF